MNDLLYYKLYNYYKQVLLLYIIIAKLQITIVYTDDIYIIC